jgi:CBS-domain-containing membrane protein
MYFICIFYHGRQLSRRSYCALMYSLPSPGTNPLSLRETTLNAVAATMAIAALGYALQLAPISDLRLPLLASMGASAFLLFVVPHSPMAQPRPMIFGQLLSALAGLASAHLVADVVWAGAGAVGTALLAMQLLRSLHPPAAATALALGTSGAHYHDQIGPFLAYAVLGNTLLLLLLTYLVNNLLLHRRYPLRHSHHAHHAEFQKTHDHAAQDLEVDDIEWALEQMDGIIDVSKEDLVDIYELAVEHAEARRNTRPTGTPP